MSCCIEQTSPLQPMDMNLMDMNLLPTLVTSPPSPLPVGGEDANTCPIQQNRKQKAPKKAVHFLPVVEIYNASSPLDAVIREDETNTWKNDLWFSAEDIAEFRNTTRDLCRQMRSAATASASTLDYDGGLSMMISTPCGVDPQTRGLEQRCCRERQRRKHTATRFILKTASQLRANHPNRSEPPEEHLATVAQRCTRWATLLAIQEAERDFVRAYFCANDDEETTEEAIFSVPPLKRRHRRRATSQCGGGALEETTRRPVRRACTPTC